MAKRIAVISGAGSDMVTALGAMGGVEAELIAPGALPGYDLNAFDALMILGGTGGEPLVFPAHERVKVEEQIGRGKRVFCEYCASISSVYFLGPTSTRFLRAAYAGGGLPLPGVPHGALLEDQGNAYLPPFLASPGARPILLYRQAAGEHRRGRIRKKELGDISKWAMWFERENLLLCMFRICNFNRARMAPLRQWRALVSAILGWVCDLPGACRAVERLEPAYRVAGRNEGGDPMASVRESAALAVAWFEGARMLKDGGRCGVEEGLGTEVSPLGAQRRLEVARTDCAGEASLMYLLHHMLTGDAASLGRADALMDFCFGPMQVRSGLCKGMLRWTETGWDTCYADDAARALLPALFRCLYTGDRSFITQCGDALDFLVRTTGTDGLRVMRTDSATLTEEAIARLAQAPAGFPSAHYNAFYLGALLLCHRLTGNETYRRVGLKGLETIMAVYPDTYREQSETEELCRLVMPLAFAYWVTGAEEQRRWLYRVAGDLQRFRHPSGAYLEWDTGYRAACSRTKGGESSLLGRNGDPVVDMLYSLNWLPVGFMQAWFVTGDDWFLGLWEDIARFFSSVQIRSADPALEGAWTRGFDVELMEVFGTPADVGWGPWAVESGWTVAEVASGLMMGLMRERLKACYGAR